MSQISKYGKYFAAAVLVIAGFAFFQNCARVNVDAPPPAPAPNIPQTVSCSLAGVWSRCSTYNANNSTYVSITATGNQIHEVIHNFNASDSCAGTPDSTLEFDANYIMGESGASTFAAGATDVTLTPNVDLFGCGPNNPTYTWLKFNGSCDQLFVSTLPPSCDPQNRGTDVDPTPFQKHP